MLFPSRILNGIRAGKVTLAFRLWSRPSVRSGGTLKTPVGILCIDGIETVTPDDISEDDARHAGFDTRNALMADVQKGRGDTFYRIRFHLAGPDPRDALRRQDRLAPADLADLLDRLGTLDRNSRSGPWTAETLRLIAECDGRTAGDIAEKLGIEKESLKRKIRQIKELGLTESLQIGYRLSDRGRVVYRAMARSP